MLKILRIFSLGVL